MQVLKERLDQQEPQEFRPLEPQVLRAPRVLQVQVDSLDLKDHSDQLVRPDRLDRQDRWVRPVSLDRQDRQGHLDQSVHRVLLVNRDLQVHLVQPGQQVCLEIVVALVLLDQQATEGQPVLRDLKETADLLVHRDLPVHWVLLVLQGYRATQDRKER
jgi:hypothetical protein